MADVIVRNMEFPQRCRGCRAAQIEFGIGGELLLRCGLDSYAHTYRTLFLLETRPDWCPLGPAQEWNSVKNGYPPEDGWYWFFEDEFFIPDHIDEADHFQTVKAAEWDTRFAGAPFVGNMHFTHWMKIEKPVPPEEEQP